MKKIIVLLVLILVLVGCGNTPQDKEVEKPPVVVEQDEQDKQDEQVEQVDITTETPEELIERVKKEIDYNWLNMLAEDLGQDPKVEITVDSFKEKFALGVGEHQAKAIVFDNKTGAIVVLLDGSHFPLHIVKTDKTYDEAVTSIENGDWNGQEEFNNDTFSYWSKK